VSNPTQHEKRILCIGVGNAFRHDDAVGLLVARRLRNAQLMNLHIVEESGEGVNLMQAWAGYEQVIIIDATCSNTEPGTIHRFAAHHVALPARFFSYSSHAFSVAEAIEMARVLGQLPSNLQVFGIEGADFSTGQGLSSCVEQAAEVLVPEIRNFVREVVP